jgi:predicted SPOUT superfamily RNA methylase MTH1
LAKKKLAVAIPASVISDTPHLREKTSKVGLIGRAAAIFRVNEIVVYPDNPKVSQSEDVDLIATLLAYIETPQYLRKRLFELRPQLQYAGILPPLRTAHHPLNRKIKNLKVGEYREGMVLSKTREGALVDIGVERPALMREKQSAADKRLTVRIAKVGEEVEVQTAKRDEIPDYWGYAVTVERHSLKTLIENRKFDLTIATSRKGAKLTDIAGELAGKWKKANSILIAFGAPTRGLYEIAIDEGINLNGLVDFVVNTIPAQGTETVRTEEALLASLAILNVQLNF